MSVGPDNSVLFNPDTPLGVGNIAQADAVRAILGLGGGALAIGAGGRALAGFGNFMDRNLSGPPRTPMRQSFVKIPVPMEEPEEEGPSAHKRRRAKTAGFDKLADFAQELAKRVGLTQTPGEAVGDLRNAISGWGTGQISKMPWAWPAVPAVVGGGLYGGWKLTDYLLDKTRSNEQESELEAARQDYEKALESRRKVASAEPRPLDALADLCEKRGLWDEALGLGLLGSGALALGSGIGAYKWTRAMSQDKAIAEAVRRRQAQLAEQAPSPIMAIPVPTPIRRPHRHKDEDEEEYGPQKVANVGQAADQFLNKIKNNQMAVWNRMMTPTDGKAPKPAKPAEPAPPQLPTLAGSWGQLVGQSAPPA